MLMSSDQAQKNAISEWSPSQWRFIELLSSQGVSGSHQTQGEMAVELGVRAETLSRWKKLPGFADAVYDLAMRHAGARLGRVLDSLAESAEKGNIQAQRLFLEVTGRIKPPGGVQNIISGDFRVEKETVGEKYSDEQLRSVAVALINGSTQ